jgi:hypothetical protein
MRPKSDKKCSLVNGWGEIRTGNKKGGLPRYQNRDVRLEFLLLYERLTAGPAG